MSDELNELLEAYFSDRITDAQLKQLEEWLRDDPNARKAFRTWSNTDDLFNELAREQAAEQTAEQSGIENFVTAACMDSTFQDHFSDFTCEPARDASIWSTSRQKFAGLVMASLLLGFIGGGFLGASWLSDARLPVVSGKIDRSAENHARPSEDNAASVDTSNEEMATTQGVAVLTDAIEPVFEGHSLRVGDAVGAKRIRLTSGTIALDFFCGAHVVLEAPAEFVPQSSWSAELVGGTVAVDVPPAARGFQINTKDGQLIDLGTRFCVSTTPQGTDLDVLDGEVQVNLKDKQYLVREGSGMSLLNQSVRSDVTRKPIRARVTPGAFGAFPADQPSFARSMAIGQTARL